MNAAAQRWEFATYVFPPASAPKYVSGFYTLDQLENDQEMVLTTMGELPQQLKKTIKEILAS